MTGLNAVHVDIKPSVNCPCGSVRAFLLDYVVGQHLVERMVLLNHFVNIV